MDPYLEHRLIDEVLYLHSLWRLAPTRSTADHSSGPLQPSNSTNFKKPGKNRRSKKPVKPIDSSGIEWPVDSPSDSPPRAASGWPELKLKPNPTVKLPSPEELARHNWNQAQQKALKATEEFFSSNVDSDGEGDESDDDEDDLMEDDGACEDKYTFFLKLLTEESELRSYFEKNCGGGGDFCCLVCGGSGKKFGKRYKDCVALIQHSVTIAKNTKRRAHRAYGQAICKVLGWEINQLPSIASNFRSTELQVNAAEQGFNALTSNMALANIVTSEAVSGMDSNACEALPDKVPEVSNAMDNEFMVCEVSDFYRFWRNARGTKRRQKSSLQSSTSVQVADVVISTTVPDKQVVNEAEANAEGVVTSLEPLKEDGVGRGGVVMRGKLVEVNINPLVPRLSQNE